MASTLLCRDAPPLFFSPSLAESIGLEPAILLQVLDNFARQNLANLSADKAESFKLPQVWLKAQLPFWSTETIERIIDELCALGMIQCHSSPLSEGGVLIFSFDDGPCLEIAEAPASVADKQPPAVPPSVAQTAWPAPAMAKNACPLPENWRPDEEVLAALEMDGIPRRFSLEQLSEFRVYWRERGDSRPAWNSVFMQRVRILWESRQARDHQQQKPSEELFDRSWAPKMDGI